jgi:hypothetical protein
MCAYFMYVILLISIVLGTSLVVHNILHKVNGPCLAQINCWIS